MFGSNYATQPELLLDSLYQMNSKYNKNFPRMSRFKKWMAGLYIKIFGIPEIGFQVRGMYFRQAIYSLSNFRPKTILDVGSGIGCYSFFLAQTYSDARVLGIEIDKNKLKEATKMQKYLKIQNVKFRYGDIVKISSVRSFYDFICIIDVLEHIKSYKRALKNIHRLLKPKGFLFIHVPQEGQVRLFKKLRNWTHEDHAREGFDASFLIDELQDMGFSVIQKKYSFGIFGKLAWELGHITLMKGAVFAALTYPLWYGLSILDTAVKNKQGLCIAILAKKR